MNINDATQHLEQAITRNELFRRTCTIARVTTVHTATIDCQPVVAISDGVNHTILPPLHEVPLFVNQGGSSYISMPVAIGDYVLLVMSDRDITQWLNGNDEVPPDELRIKNLSDAIAFPCINNNNNVVPIPEKMTIKGHLIHEGNTTETGDTTKTGKSTIKGDVDVTGNVTIDGNLTVTGTITCATVEAGNFTGKNGGAMQSTVDMKTTGTITSSDVVSGGKSMNSHTHTAPSGGGKTSPPN